MIQGIGFILNEPGLVEYLVSSRWGHDFERATLSRSRSLTGPSRMSRLKVFVEDDEIIARAVVKGNAHWTFHPCVEFLRDGGGDNWEFWSECDCAEEIGCLHAAALLHRLSVEAANAGPVEDVEQNLLSEAIRQVPGLSGWLQRVEKACRGKGQPAQRSEAAGLFLAYCLPRTNGKGPPVLELRCAQHRSDGSTRIEPAKLGPLAPGDPSVYVKEEDRLILLLCQNLPRVARASSYQLELSGFAGKEVLERSLATGRLYSLRDKADEGGVRLSAGPSRKVSLDWVRVDGGVQPVLKGDPGLSVIPVQPPMAIDEAEATLCPLDCGEIPAELVALWREGPLVPERFVRGIAERIGAKKAKVAVPVPEEMETRFYKDEQPIPALNVKLVRVDLAFRPRFEILLGEVTFRYGESPRLMPMDTGDPPTSEVFEGGIRHVVSRSKSKESDLQKRLYDFDLVPIQSLLSGIGNLSPGIRHAVVPENPFPTRECAWIEFLHGGGADTLRTEGWKIEAEDPARLAVHDVSDFVTRLDGESGIDWFRFDAGFELEGKRFSLIPFIAAYLERHDGIPDPEDPMAPEWVMIPAEDSVGGMVRFPAKRMFELVQTVQHLLTGYAGGDGTLRVHRLQAAGLAAHFKLDSSPTLSALKKLGETLRDFKGLPTPKPPSQLKGSLRAYQCDGFHWMQFLARNDLHGILADDMGLGKTVQALTHLLAEKAGGHAGGKPSLVLAPTSVVPNWESEAKRFAPSLKTLVLHGPDRAVNFKRIGKSDLVVTSYALLSRDFEELNDHQFHAVILDEAQHVKNPQAKTAQLVCDLRASHRMCLSGTPLQNHLGELWSLMRFLMPGYLGDADAFRRFFRTPIEKAGDTAAQAALNRRVAPLLLRRTKDEVAGELPAKTEILHRITLTEKQIDLYESVRAAMDKRVRDAIAAKGLERSHIIVLDALLKLRQICCHPKLLKTPAAQKVGESAKLMFLTDDLLPTLIEEGRRILLFSQFTSMLALIEEWFDSEKVPFVKLTGQTKDRKTVVQTFQEGKVPVFLISLKAGGTGLNLTAADTVIHYDPWWNPAVEAQATDRAHRIGQDKPVFVHKLICGGTIEERIQELQAKKSALVEALLSENTNKLRIDRETLSDLLAPMR